MFAFCVLLCAEGFAFGCLLVCVCVCVCVFVCWVRVCVCVCVCVCVVPRRVPVCSQWRGVQDDSCGVRAHALADMRLGPTP